MTNNRILHGWLDLYPHEWQRIALGDVCRVRRGASPRPAGDPRYFGGDIPWIKISDATAEIGRWISRTEEYVNEGGKERSVFLERGALILSNSGTTGQPKFLAIDGCIHDGWLAFDRFSGIDPAYLFYLLSWRTPYLTHIADGSVQKNLNTGLLKGLEIGLPPLQEQRAIARILGTLDDKIELNQITNETLEAMARAIFKSWFVDFDPVRAKMEGRLPVGMDGETAALFPDALQDSPLGKIPRGWSGAAIGEVVRCVGGTTPSTKEPSFWDGDIAFATPRDLASLQTPVLLRTERCITQDGLHQISSGLLPRGTVLLSSRAPIGYLAIAELPVAVNQGFIAMVCDGPLPNLYVLNWAYQNMDIIEANANGTTFLEISKASFRPLRVLVPPPQILESFMKRVESLYGRMTQNLRESETLAAIRNALLPRLLSGEIRVTPTEETTSTTI